MNKKILLIIISLFFFFTGKAQIYNTHNFYTQNLFFYSPAHTGDKEQFAAFIAYRDYLTGIEDAVQSGVVGIHSPITKRMNLGTLIKTERIGLFETLSGRLDYSFRTKISDNQLLAFGINGGFLQRSLNTDNAVVLDLDDPTLTPDYAKKYIAFAGASINYQIQHFSLDIALPVIYRSTDVTVQNYLAFMSYSFYTSEKKWMFQPSVAGNYIPGKIFNYHANLLINFNNLFWIQPTYKSNKSLSFSAGVNISKVGIAYAYETNSGVLSNIGGSSHEIMLTYGFFKSRKNKVDTVPDEISEPEKRLKRKIGGKTYEEYVSSNNYGFYNSIISLTDSIHKEDVKIDSLKLVAKNDSILKARNDSVLRTQTEILEKAKKDSLEKVRRDSIRQATFRNLNEDELELLKGGVHFELGSAMINAEGRRYLDEVAALLKSNENFKLVITGHTCDIGSREVNLRFSEDRSEAVYYYLLRKGVDPKRIFTDAKLDAEPVVPNTSEHNRQMNRRVSFSVVRE